MLNLGEYRQRADRLADHLPWAALIAPGVILNKDGSFQRTFRFRGPDLESSTPGQLVAAAARANNMLRRFGSGWALFVEARRSEAPGYPQSKFPDPASWIVDKEREANFLERDSHFESRYFLTLLWLPPADQQSKIETLAIERPEARTVRSWPEALAAFIERTDRVLDLMAGFMAEVEPLGDAETLSFLHEAVSDRPHLLTVPETPIHLDAILADAPLTGGLEPKLGERHLRTITVTGFPAVSSPGILDALNNQPFGYRWSSRFIALDKLDANKNLVRLRRQWFNKRKSVTALLREVMYNQPAQLIDNDADNKSADADAALQLLGDDQIAFGFLTVTISVDGPTAAIADGKMRSVERIVHSLGFTTIQERLNAVEAWLSSLPGHVYANVRQPLVHTLNLAHLLPLSAVWAGPAENRHLGGPPLLLAKTNGSTPFRLSTHIGDVGHMMVVGPTGAGKSVLLSLLALQFRRYAGARVFIFDKGLSARGATLAMGGTHHPLGAPGDHGDLAFQPLAHIDEAGERVFAAEWLWSLLEQQKVEITPEVKDMVWTALLNLASAPPSERTLSGLALLLGSNALKAALLPFTLDGPFGALLDSDADRLILADVHCFETEALFEQPSALGPVLSYLFHRLEGQFDGRPTLLLLDEAWLFLDHPMFSARIREWLKVLRKKNVAVVFSTQSLVDILDSPIASAIIESCPQRIFLPNDRAAEPQSRDAYRRFGLNDTQIELIARATPKRDYYLQSRAGNRRFDLELGPIALALCGSSSPADQRRLDSLAEVEPSRRAEALLSSAGLLWAADLLDQFPQPPAK